MNCDEIIKQADELAAKENAALMARHNKVTAKVVDVLTQRGYDAVPVTFSYVNYHAWVLYSVGVIICDVGINVDATIDTSASGDGSIYISEVNIRVLARNIKLARERRSRKLFKPSKKCAAAGVRFQYPTDGIREVEPRWI